MDKFEQALRDIVEIGVTEQMDRCGDMWSETGYQLNTHVSEEAKIAMKALGIEYD